MEFFNLLVTGLTFLTENPLPVPTPEKGVDFQAIGATVGGVIVASITGWGVIKAHKASKSSGDSASEAKASEQNAKESAERSEALAKELREKNQLIIDLQVKISQMEERQSGYEASHERLLEDYVRVRGTHG
jgi:hypothetical protein